MFTFVRTNTFNMKRLFILSSIVLLSFSCKRIYQCECKQVINYEDWNAIVTNFPIEDNSKKDAETFCHASPRSAWRAAGFRAACG